MLTHRRSTNRGAAQQVATTVGATSVEEIRGNTCRGGTCCRIVYIVFRLMKTSIVSHWLTPLLSRAWSSRVLAPYTGTSFSALPNSLM